MWLCVLALATLTPPISDDDGGEKWEPETVDEIRGELEACEEAMTTRPRVIGAVALGTMNGCASLYRLNRKFHIDDPDVPPGTPEDEAGGPWVYSEYRAGRRGEGGASSLTLRSARQSHP